MTTSAPTASTPPDRRAEALVLSTVNAPFKQTIDAADLAEGIRNAGSKKWPAHLVAFFTDVRPKLILDFAQAHSIPLPVLRAAYTAIKSQSGASNDALELELSRVALAKVA